MARRNLEVIVTVRDAATAPLKQVEGQLKNTGKAANTASADFTKFNRTLFATTAFVGTFIKAFSSMNEALNQGAELDRLQTQYERVLGPKGNLLKSIRGMTSTSIDEMEAMRDGLKLANLGIAQNSDQVAEIMAKSATAAKLAGLDASEGMKKISDFMASGSVSNLEFLGLLSRTNPALQAQMAILNKAGGVMGTVISTQQKLAIGMGLLNAAVKGNLKGGRDLVDIMFDFRQSIDQTRREIGRFLGVALGPLIEKFSTFMYGVRDSIEYYRKHEKNLVFLAKAMILTTGAVLGLAGALGTLNLMVKLLGFAGIGLPGLIITLFAVTTAFLGVTHSADSLIERLKLFGAFIHGIYQLIESLDPETGFSKMDKSIQVMLQRAGLLTLAQNIARVGSVIKTVVMDAIHAFQSLSHWLDKTFGGISHTIIKALDKFKEPWSNFWVRDSISPIQKFMRTALVLFGGFFAILAGKKLFGMFGSMLSKIPVIGKLFGGGGKNGGPAGTANDPIYTRSADGAAAGIGKNLLGGIFNKIPDFMSKPLGRVSAWIASRLVGFSMMFDRMKNVLLGGLSRLMGIIGPMVGPAVAVAAAAGIGVALGLLTNKLLDKYTQGETDEGFKGNILERGFYKLFATDEQKANERKAKAMGLGSATGGAEQTSVAVPSVPGNQSDMIDSLGETMKGLDGDKRSKFQQSVEQALASNSPGGAAITPDEYTSAMVQALDNSENLSILANKAKQNPAIQAPSSRRIQK